MPASDLSCLVNRAEAEPHSPFIPMSMRKNDAEQISFIIERSELLRFRKFGCAECCS
jgi:hypothetical protein